MKDYPNHTLVSARLRLSGVWKIPLCTPDTLELHKCPEQPREVHRALDLSCQQCHLPVPHVSHVLSVWWHKWFQACVVEQPKQLVRFTKWFKNAYFKINTQKNIVVFYSLVAFVVLIHALPFSLWIAIIMFINYLWNGFQAEADWLHSAASRHLGLARSHQARHLEHRTHSHLDFILWPGSTQSSLMKYGV